MPDKSPEQRKAGKQFQGGINRRGILRRSSAAFGIGGFGIDGLVGNSVTEPAGLLESCSVDQFKDAPPDYPILDLRRADPTTTGNFPEGANEFVIYIHGFIEKFVGGGANQGFTLEQALQQNGYEKPTVTAVWDSNVPVYQLSQQQAKTAGRRLAMFLDEYLDEHPNTKIRLVGHSLGSLVTLETLCELAGDHVLTSASLLGAAVDPDLVCEEGRYFPGIANAAKTVHSYHSRSDYAVCKASGLLEVEFQPDLGCDGAECEASASPPKNYADVDVTDAVAAHCDYMRPEVGCVPRIVDNF